MTKTVDSIPKQDNFRMPGEFEPHEETWMLWPQRTDTWRHGAKPAQKTFIDVAAAISKFEPVTIGVPGTQFEHARSMIPEKIRVVEISSNDAWIRDTGPSFLKNDRGEVRGVDWSFNAWGGLDEGLYFPWHLDIDVKQKVMEIEHIDHYNARDLVLEGGAFTVDGEGTMITTEQCVLNKNRNPSLSRIEIENKLKDYLNLDKIIWLKNGMINDETDGHVDEVAFFVRPGVVALSWTDDQTDPQYPVLSHAYEQLKHATDARGRKLEIHKIQLPTQVEMTIEESEGIEVAAESFERLAGMSFPASYVNCYLCNGGVVMPAFGDPEDDRALEKMQSLFPDRDIVQVHTRELSLGGGNIHCMTQQQPRP